ncbi:MAG TPA: FAD-dependent monooxygenase, partial [Micrococcaceae bacterium]|nr:FAD-dependent monooxygenase [Micrococcaceae bacterium]
GLLFIGDAAHAMSPVGGVGINLAVQDAVCAARVLAGPLLAGGLDARRLASVQRRRWFPTAGTQLLQRAAQRFLVAPTLAGTKPVRAPLPLRVLSRFPRLQAVPARIIGIGLRPERLS